MSGHPPGGPDAGGPAPLAVVDVHYAGRGGRAACVVARGWADAVPIEVREHVTAEVADYVPGRFYERELPPVLGVLERLSTAVRAIVVDGYVVLDEDGTPGLGAHLHRHFDGRYTVIGVAKRRYRSSTVAVPVRRGRSRQPLFVTALGLPHEVAAALVAGMHGEHRIPTLLALADRRARGLSFN
ncbi:MAG TPA: endonuclease V [Acidimicrobiales bacterium]|nr:endonuclease V [Acidimicrobiales bacterium]